MSTRNPNPCRVKMHRNYTVHEIAILFKIHRNTVRRWLASGLERVEGRGQTLVRGQALRTYLASRRSRLKRPCAPGFMYCLRCRDPKEPSGQVAELIQTDDATGNLRGLCPDCCCLMHRRVNLARLEHVRGRLVVTVPAVGSRIGEGSYSPVNGDYPRNNTL